MSTFSSGTAAGVN